MSANGNGPESSRLEGRIALVSGGAQGIGRAIAERFQTEGAHVVLLDHDYQAGQTAARELTIGYPERRVEFLNVDLERPEQIRQAVDTIRADYNRLDILVNNAGIEVEKPVAETTVAEWDHVLDVNLRAAFLLSQASLSLFPASGGAIINISSIHATHAFPNSAAYACSKAGLIALTRNLALELAPRGIRVNSVCPGYVDTRLWEDYLRRSGDAENLAAQTAALHPVGRRGLPADVAEAVIFFAVDSRSFITGTNLVVDGGLTIRAHP